VANAGAPIYCKVGDIATLDGSKSTVASGRVINFIWTSSSLNPIAVSLSSIAYPSFIPSIPGVYTFQLRVSDGSQTSKASTVQIIVSSNYLSVRKGLPNIDYSSVDSIQKRPLFYSSIEAAIRSAHSGDTILIYEGLYLENCSHFISGIVLLGKDRFRSIIDGGFRSFDSTVSQNTDSVGSSIFLDSVSNISIMNCTIRHGGRSQRPNDQDAADISCHMCSNINIVNNEIVESGNDGIRITASSNIEIMGNHVANNRVNGIRNSNSHILVNSNLIEGNGSSITPVKIEPYSGISIECDPPYCTGLQIDVYGNEFRDNRTYSIKMWSNSNANIVGNTFSGAGGGIYFTTVNNLVLDRNTFEYFFPPPQIDTVYIIIDKKLNESNNTAEPPNDSIKVQGEWGGNNLSRGSIGLSNAELGIVIALPHLYNDSYKLTITTNGTLINLQQYSKGEYPYQWFDTLHYRRVQW
jgi:parallel beta-helix repeat protein